ncbi:YgaP family membrane protein [Halopiger xanaduensis]|uniref:Inner membrane protein YgaP-like transmembrane domain-containing protein n=1 Tax=Halopiger xanaduensis (strain DSM 18323 / JCM 14033 / SH-6) TaxID=797210 RepID=F8DEB5_HALXS|nr:DUF2892 domain-containing protein [Halopiger xanaduensis]AEH39397.1 hypothetical protein Halxa_0154 [Halopiger xanaduensis SH-6]
MEHNIGWKDQIARTVGGAGLAAVGIAALSGALDVGTTLGAVALLIGGILPGTALTRTCLLYRILGVDTAA